MDNNELKNLIDLFDSLDDDVKESPLGGLISSGLDLLKSLDEFDGAVSQNIEVEDGDEPEFNDDCEQKHEDEEKQTLPSERIDDMNKKLEIHRIVQTYVDTEIKPYVGGEMTQSQIDDAYSALYEFACWILTR